MRPQRGSGHTGGVTPVLMPLLPCTVRTTDALFKCTWSHLLLLHHLCYQWGRPGITLPKRASLSRGGICDTRAPSTENCVALNSCCRELLVSLTLDYRPGTETLASSVPRTDKMPTTWSEHTGVNTEPAAVKDLKTHIRSRLQPFLKQMASQLEISTYTQKISSYQQCLGCPLRAPDPQFCPYRRDFLAQLKENVGHIHTMSIMQPIKMRFLKN